MSDPRGLDAVYYPSTITTGRPGRDMPSPRGGRRGWGRPLRLLGARLRRQAGGCEARVPSAARDRAAEGPS